EQFFTRFRQDTRQMTLDALTRVFEENFSFRVPDGLARAAAPTLAVVGEREAPVLRRSACDIVAALAHAEGRVVASASHNWMLTAPERFADMVARWTTGQPLPDWLLPLPC